MDEIDAALDFKNVSIVANYIKERTRNAQFIIISLRSNMFELAGKVSCPILQRPHIETETHNIYPLTFGFSSLKHLSSFYNMFYFVDLNKMC